MEVNNRNTGLWTAGGAVLGAGAGVGVAAVVKPYLKKGEPSEKLANNISNDVFMTQEKYKSIQELADGIEAAKDKEEIVNLITTEGKYKNLSEDFVNKIKNAQDKKEIKKIFKETSFFDMIGVDAKDVKLPDGKELYKNFKENKDSLPKEAQEAIEKALKNAKKNSMLLFGGIGAVVLATTALLLSRKKES